MINLKNKEERDALHRNIVSGAVQYLFGNQSALDMLDAIDAIDQQRTRLEERNSTLHRKVNDIAGERHRQMIKIRDLERDLDKLRGVGVAPAMQELMNRNERQAEMIRVRDTEITRLNDRYQLACRELMTYRDGVTMFRKMLGI